MARPPRAARRPPRSPRRGISPRDPAALRHDVALADRRRSQHYDELMRERAAQPIIAFWHGRILPAHALLPRSRHRGHDQPRTSTANGSRGSSRFGYGTARGSTSRGGGARARAAAPRSARRTSGRLHGRRPARSRAVAQPGAVWLAGATGHPSCRSTSKRVLAGRSELGSHADPEAVLQAGDGHRRSHDGACTADDVVEAARVALEESLRRLEKQTTLMLLRAAIPLTVWGRGAERLVRGRIKFPKRTPRVRKSLAHADCTRSSWRRLCTHAAGSVRNRIIPCRKWPLGLT